MGDTFRVLLVCTANICRSPMAEYLLRDAVTGRWGLESGWVIESAGMQAQTGLAMHHYARAALERRGRDGTEFRSRRVTRQAIEDADLILTAERSHRAGVVTIVPAAVSRTFTMLQFARLVAHAEPPDHDVDPVLFGRHLIDAAVAARSRWQPPAAREDNLADPIGRRPAAFRRCADQLSTVAAAMVTPRVGASRTT